MPASAPDVVLFVCTANRCRSPLAATTLSHHARAAGLPWQVRSAGVRAHWGDVTEPHAVSVLLEAGFSAEARPARKLDAAALADVGVVLTAERRQRSLVLERRPDLVGQVFTMLEFERLLSAGGSTQHQRRSRSVIELALYADGARSLCGPGGPFDDLPDPIGRPIEAFRQCQRVVERVVARMVRSAVR